MVFLSPEEGNESDSSVSSAGDFNDKLFWGRMHLA
jgi:hypothetical protein